MRPSSAQNADRREYFRIDDEVAMKYRVVDEEDVNRSLDRRHAGYPDAGSIMSSFLTTQVDMKRVLERCKRELPDVATCLESLSSRLDLLTRFVIAGNSDLPDHPTHDVNLSASGIAFRSTEPLTHGGVLEIKMLFFPSLLYMLAYARVVRCAKLPDGHGDFPYDVAVEFHHMDDGDRELLIRHVLQKEAALLREARDKPVSHV